MQPEPIIFLFTEHTLGRSTVFDFLIFQTCQYVFVLRCTKPAKHAKCWDIRQPFEVRHKKTWLELLSLSICTISQSLLTPPLEHVFVADYYYCIMPESIKSSCSIQHFQALCAGCAHVTSASLSQPNLNLAQAFLSLAQLKNEQLDFLPCMR